MAGTEDVRRAPLEKSIVEARRLLKDHYEYFAGNETATRVVVIDRVLTAIGWDVRDPTQVRLEYRANGTRVDYALLSPSREYPLAIVEAKAADSGLKDMYRRDASGYAAEVGARYALLTNGGRWEAWQMLQGTPRRKTTLVAVHLTTGTIAEVVSRLRMLEQEALERRERG